MPRTREIVLSFLSVSSLLVAQSPVGSAGGQDPAGPGDSEIAAAIQKYFETQGWAKASYGKKGFRLESQDGNFQTNLQWRAQIRFTQPTRSDPRQVDDFEASDKATGELRRVRMKIGGHGYRPWLKYYFEVDLQPTRSSGSSSAGASSRVIDWRIDVAKSKAFGIRVGQWKIDYNRERVDSSGRQQFVERSIVNRPFTIDRQMGAGVRGRLFEGTAADFRYYVGAFTGEGRGVANDDRNLMYVTRLQWNFLGRDLPLRQTDVERTEKPTGTFALGAATHTGRATRWSSSGGGNLDGFDSVSSAMNAQHRINQAVAEFAFKYQGFSTQNEFHWKSITDKSMAYGMRGRETDMYGLYTQAGYFFHEMCECFPEELELAARYAWVKEPNEMMRTSDNERQEFTVAANWFFAGHNNKLTLDVSYLTLDDNVLGSDKSTSRVRLQWDISF
ncbi:MAG: OprO/OprP family phosphate-selective porin [bacterium]|nr:OprO/OprP family phosphate-selective porin [bacterium]